MKEIYKLWKDNIYISNFGNVKGRKILHWSNGYYRITYKHKSFALHRLVAELFIPNPENKKEVDHIDTNKLNNNINNLRWVQPSENMNNPLTIQHKRNIWNNKKHYDKIYCVELNLYFDTPRDACEYLNLNKSCVCGIRSSCRTGYKAYNYHWKQIMKGGDHDKH